MEVQSHGLEQQVAVTEGTHQDRPAPSAPPSAGPTTRTTSRPSTRVAHEALLCIQTGTTMSDPNRWKFSSNEFYVKSADEMRAVFKDLPEAYRNTLAVAERCNVDLQFGQFHLPKYQVPDGFTLDSYLEERALEGLKWRYGSLARRRGGGAAPLRAGRGLQDGLLRLLPGGLGLHQLRAPPGHRGGAGPRLLGGLAGGLLPRHHQRGPDPLRADLRALPQPRADLDAGHGHRLRGRPARRGHPLRGRSLRGRPGGPHHHVRDHGGQGGHPRRGPRARLLLRRGGPHRQAGARLPAQHLARRGAREGPAARRAGQARPAGGGDVGGGPRARGLHPARLGARLRGGHLGRAPDGAGAALQGPQAARAHHRLRDGAHREARPAQDGLPRAQDPHRDLGRPAPAQGVARDRARRRRPAARRRPDLPAPQRGPHLRGVPAGVGGHAGRAQAPQAPAHRGHHRDGGPVPAGPDGPDRGLRQPQARPRRDLLRASR